MAWCEFASPLGRWERVVVDVVQAEELGHLDVERFCETEHGVYAGDSLACLDLLESPDADAELLEVLLTEVLALPKGAQPGAEEPEEVVGVLHPTNIGRSSRWTDGSNECLNKILT